MILPPKALPYRVLDKSPTRLISRMLAGAVAYSNDFDIDTRKMINGFATSQWFAKRLKESGIVELLDFGLNGQEAKTLEGLLFAYQYPSTLDSLISIFYALFGENAIVEVSILPGQIFINLSNANENFIAGLSAVPNKALVNSDSKWILANIFGSAGVGPINEFFRQFCDVGVVIQVNIIDTKKRSKK